MSSINYWNIFTDYNLPTYQRVAGGALLPLMGPLTLLGVGCSPQEPSLEENKPGVDQTKSIGSQCAEEPVANAQCQANPCKDGYLDPASIKNGKGLCIQFAEQHECRGLEFEKDKRFNKVSVVDLNNDGFQDLYFLSNQNQVFLWNNQTHAFEKGLDQSGLNQLGKYSVHAAWKDENGDGILDYLFLVGSRESHLYKNINGVFTLLSPDKGIHHVDPYQLERGNTAVWIGMDVLLGTRWGLHYYRHQGDGRYVEQTTEAGLKENGEVTTIAVADYDLDGDEDVFVGEINGKNRLFKNKGDGTFESVEDNEQINIYGRADDAQWISHGANTYPELFVANWSNTSLEGEGNNHYCRTPQGGFEECSSRLGIHSPGMNTSSTWANLNGESPALYLGRFNNPNSLFIPRSNQSGNLSYQDIAPQLGLNLSDLTIATHFLDFNQDGHLDLLVLMDSGAIYLFKNRTREAPVCP